METTAGDVEVPRLLTDAQLREAVAQAAQLSPPLTAAGAKPCDDGSFAAGRAVGCQLARMALALVAMQDIYRAAAHNIPAVLKFELQKEGCSHSQAHPLVAAAAERIAKWLLEHDELRKCKTSDAAVRAVSQVVFRKGDARSEEVLSPLINDVAAGILDRTKCGILDRTGKTRGRESHRGGRLPKRRRRAAPPSPSS
uniref:Uncharacterized protein n=1 Tax=Calcidiscus leptoporus TaxID=127549 RepID=A0A7S0P5I6_9EUKA|mmetsp:Transcript_625/g.1401  ORF Transcript_625/g.1401 Transcript_625/m.1401 type:complete len:197 (+) Transcript_625:64-654(+)